VRPQAGQETLVEKEVLRIRRQLERDSGGAKLVLHFVQAADRHLPRRVLGTVVWAGSDAGEAQSHQDAGHLQRFLERLCSVVQTVQQKTMQIAQGAHRSGIRRIRIGGRGWRFILPLGSGRLRKAVFFAQPLTQIDGAAPRRTERKRGIFFPRSDRLLTNWTPKLPRHASYPYALPNRGATRRPR